MATFYFTFGCGQRLAGFCQPILASDWNKAREVMIENYGVKWCWQYDEEGWQKIPIYRREELMPLLNEEGEPV